MSGQVIVLHTSWFIGITMSELDLVRLIKQIAVKKDSAALENEEDSQFRRNVGGEIPPTVSR